MRTPLDLPEPDRLHRTLRNPPDSGTTSPALGLAEIKAANAPRSS